MIVRAGRLGIVALAMLAASPCLAQENQPEPTAQPAPAAAPASTTTGPAPGRGAVGGLIGVSKFYASEEYSQGSLPRFDLSGHFRYVFSRRFRAQLGLGFTWSAYSKEEPPPFTDIRFPNDLTKEEYLTLLIPVSAQLQMTWGKSPWQYHIGAGPGVYRVWVQNHRKVLQDPQTLRFHRGLYTGFSAQAGAERFLKSLPSTSAEVSLAHHYVLATRDEQFPTGWNSTLGVLALRAGVNYYFDLNRQKKEPELPLPAGAR